MPSNRFQLSVQGLGQSLVGLGTACAIAAAAVSGCAVPVTVKASPIADAQSARPRLPGVWVVRIHADELRRLDAMRLPGGFCPQMRFDIDAAEAFRQSALAAARRRFETVADSDDVSTPRRVGQVAISARLLRTQFRHGPPGSASPFWRGTTQFRPYIDVAAEIIVTAPTGRRFTALVEGSGEAAIEAPGGCLVVEKAVAASYADAISKLAESLNERLGALPVTAADLR